MLKILSIKSCLMRPKSYVFGIVCFLYAPMCLLATSADADLCCAESISSSVHSDALMCRGCDRMTPVNTGGGAAPLPDIDYYSVHFTASSGERLRLMVTPSGDGTTELYSMRDACLPLTTTSFTLRTMDFTVGEQLCMSVKFSLICGAPCWSMEYIGSVDHKRHRHYLSLEEGDLYYRQSCCGDPKRVFEKVRFRGMRCTDLIFESMVSGAEAKIEVVADSPFVRVLFQTKPSSLWEELDKVCFSLPALAASVPRFSLEQCIANFLPRLNNYAAPRVCCRVLQGGRSVLVFYSYNAMFDAGLGIEYDNQKNVVVSKFYLANNQQRSLATSALPWEDPSWSLKNYKVIFSDGEKETNMSFSESGVVTLQVLGQKTCYRLCNVDKAQECTEAYFVLHETAGPILIFTGIWRFPFAIGWDHQQGVFHGKIYSKNFQCSQMVLTLPVPADGQGEDVFFSMDALADVPRVNHIFDTRGRLNMDFVKRSFTSVVANCKFNVCVGHAREKHAFVYQFFVQKENESHGGELQICANSVGLCELACVVGGQCVQKVDTNAALERASFSSVITPENNVLLILHINPSDCLSWSVAPLGGFWGVERYTFGQHNGQINVLDFFPGVVLGKVKDAEVTIPVTS